MFESNCVIVLIAPEISIKSSTVRSFMVSKLRKNILLYLNYFKIKTGAIFYTSGRLIIPTNEPTKVVLALKDCFGILNLYLAQEFKFNSLKDVCVEAKNIIDGGFCDESFAVRGKSFSKEFSSKDLEIELGGVVLDCFPKMKVKLKDPQKEIFCITQKDKAFVYFDLIKGAGGMPVSVQGKAGILCNKGTKREDLFFIGKNLMKCGASIILVSDDELNFDLSELEKHNSYISIKTIPISLARDYSKKGSLRAFFSCAKTEIDFKKDCELIEEKIFAPFLF